MLRYFTNLNIVIFFSCPTCYKHPIDASESSNQQRSCLTLDSLLPFLLAAISLSLTASAVAHPTIQSLEKPTSLKGNQQSPAQKALTKTSANLVTRAGLGLGPASGTAIGDVNEDGKPDLLLSGGRSELLLQQDDGTFVAAGADLVDASSGSADIVDVDGQNGPDLLITGIGDGFTAETVLHLQQPDGSFSRANAGLEGVRYSSTDVGNVDGQNGPDLLVVGENENGDPTATLYLQQPDGSFSAANAGLDGVSEGSANIADVDGQNGPDLLITGQDANGNSTAKLYLQQSGGGFSPANANLDGVTDGSSAIADVDGQNGPDLLIAGGSSTTLYLQQPDGSFSPANANLTGVLDAAVSIGDIDNQNGPDLLVTGEANFEPSATLYLQQSGGGFAPADAGLTGVENFSTDMTSIGDVDGDSDLDLLITSGNDALFGRGSTRLYINRTVQTDPNRAPRLAKAPFAQRRATGTTVSGRYEFGDLDGDKLSLELTQSPSTGTVSFTDFGNGTGEIEFVAEKSQAGQTIDLTVEAADGSGETTTASFQVTLPNVLAGLNLPGLEEATSTLADIDGQNGPDVLVIGNGGVTLYLQQPDGSFSLVDTPNITPVASGDVAVGDVDQDDRPDLLITGGDFASVTATLYLQQPDGSFSPANANLTDVSSGSASIADVDGQNGPDLLITGEDENDNPTTTLYLQQSGGGFSPANANLTDVFQGAASIADVDDQNGPDLLITGEDASGNLTATLYRQQSDGGFSPADADLTGLQSSSTTIADIDGQNGPDLLLAGQNSDFRPSSTLYLQQPDGSFSAANADLAGVQRGSSTDIADVDGDGDGDLIITGEPSTAKLYLQQSDGTFTEAQAGLPGVDRSSASFADLDGDADPDLLITGQTNQIVNAQQFAPATILYENLLDPAEAVASQDVPSGASSQTFSETGTKIDFSSGTSGSGPARVVKYGIGPSTTPGLPTDANISEYRFVVNTGPGLDVGSGTELRFDVSTLKGTPNPEDIQVYRRNPPGDGFYGNSPGASSFSKLSESNVRYESGSGELVATIDGFSEFVFTSSSNSLPVELARFDAQVIEKSVRLTWQTTTETKSAGFEVQRQKENGWTQVGYVESKAQGGTTTETKSYSYAAEDLPVGTHQFRLRQVDLDGSSTLTDPVTVDIQMQKAVKLTAPAPNPASSNATLSFAVKEQAETTIRLYNTLGQQVATVYAGTPQAGEEQTARVDVSGLPSGAYFLRLSADGQTRTQRLTVVR
jgi:hypothetical protein